MSNVKTTKLIERAFLALEALDDITQTHYRSKIFNMASIGERQHRRGGGEYRCTVTTAAKLFTVRWLVHYVAHPEKLPTIGEALGLRDDVVLAAMVAANYRDKILNMLEGFNLEQLERINYVALVEGRADESLGV